MAYENGYEAVNYIGSCIERYKEDHLIFTKAAQIIPVFISRPDWPHCFDELDNAIGNILGESLSNLIFGFTERYLNDKRIIWPDDLPEGFKEELSAFHLATNSLVDQFLFGRTKPMKLFSIARSQSFDGQIIRFIRMDGATLDIEIDDTEIEKIIDALQSFRKKQGEQLL